jgi:hypothetical protein
MYVPIVIMTVTFPLHKSVLLNLHSSSWRSYLFISLKQQITTSQEQPFLEQRMNVCHPGARNKIAAVFCIMFKLWLQSMTIWWKLSLYVWRVRSDLWISQVRTEFIQFLVVTCFHRNLLILMWRKIYMTFHVPFLSSTLNTCHVTGGMYFFYIISFMVIQIYLKNVAISFLLNLIPNQ